MKVRPNHYRSFQESRISYQLEHVEDAKPITNDYHTCKFNKIIKMHSRHNLPFTEWIKNMQEPHIYVAHIYNICGRKSGQKIYLLRSIKSHEKRRVLYSFV